MNDLKPGIFIVPVIALVLVVLLYFSLLKKTPNRLVFRRFTFIVILFSFLLNFFWEFAQLPLYKDYAYDIQHIAFCALASVADVLMVLLLYFGLALLYKNPFWVKALRFQRVFILMVVGGIGAIAAETLHTSAANWIYAEAMPIIPYLNVGLSPVLQFFLLPVLIYYFSFYFLKKTSGKNNAHFINT